MGLDMNLYKKHYVKNWDYMKPEEKHSISIKKNGEEVKEINTSKIVYVEEEVAYWRKANQIHKWFIDNCADGDGNQTEMSVSDEQIKELYQLCLKVKTTARLVDGKIKNGERGGKDAKGNLIWIPIMVDGKFIENAEEIAELLPTESGFFFGSTDYDEYYMNDIEHTIDVLEPEVKLIEAGDNMAEYHYSASW